MVSALASLNALALLLFSDFALGAIIDIFFIGVIIWTVAIGVIEKGQKTFGDVLPVRE